MLSYEATLFLSLRDSLPPTPAECKMKHMPKASVSCSVCCRLGRDHHSLLLLKVGEGRTGWRGRGRAEGKSRLSAGESGDLLQVEHGHTESTASPLGVVQNISLAGFFPRERERIPLGA